MDARASSCRAGLPFFAPELFRSVELLDPMRSKQLNRGLQELGEEGSIQVFRPVLGNNLLLGAIGVLQFEVAAHRLKSEYGVEVRMAPANYFGARWISADDDAELRRFCDNNQDKLAVDAAQEPAYLLSSRYDLELTQKHWPLIHFHAMREHAGLELQS